VAGKILAVDRRRAALYALIVFAVASAVAIVISGSRPAGQQGALPWVVQGVGASGRGR
jgi:hypothetical protein